MKPALFPYQDHGATWLAAGATRFLFDAMGVGKTAQAIVGADRAGARRVLVLCPAVARENWRREFLTWQTLDRSLAVVRSGADLARRDIVAADVLIVSYGLLASPGAVKRLAADRRDLLIADEAHALKTPDAKRTLAVYGRGCRRDDGLAATCDRVWLLTGTPMPNHPGELWSHVRALAPAATENGAGRPMSHAQWLEEFCHLQDTVYGVQVRGSRNIPDLLRRVRPFILRRKAEDVLTDLPPLRWGHVSVQPDRMPPRPNMPHEVEAVLHDALVKMKAGHLDEEEAAALLETLQASTMHLATLRRWTGIAKAEAVADLLREELDAGLGKVVVFFVHREVSSTIIGRLGADLPGSCALIDGNTTQDARQRAVDGFQGRVPGWSPRVLLCQLAVAATALTLTAACDVVFAETSWTPSDTLQAAKRCHRIGQDRPVLARIVSLAGSLDEIVNTTIARKNRDISRIEERLENGL